MVALSREDAVTLLARRKPGPVGRDDVHRPVVCPEGHIGANIRFDRMGGTDPQYARANYRCARMVTLDDGAKVEVRHSFVLRGGEDPLPRRHPRFQCPDNLDPEAVHWRDGECNHYERTFASDDGLRAGRAFYFAIIEIARFLVTVSTGLTVTAAVKEMRPRRGPRRQAHPQPPPQARGDER